MRPSDGGTGRDSGTGTNTVAALTVTAITVASMSSTLQWLRDRSNDELAELLAARPDLLLPAPPDLAALARRMDGSATVRRAVGQLDAFGVQVLQAVWLLGDVPTVEYDAVPGDSDSTSPSAQAVSAADVHRLLGGPATRDEVEAALTRLHVQGLIRGDASGYLPAPAVREALGRYPAGLGIAAGLSREEVAHALAGVGEAGLRILRRLVPGPPVGSVEAGSRHGDTIASLVAARLLVDRGDGTVMLPREVALELRGERPLGPADPNPPLLDATPVEDVDGTAAGQALACHAHTVALLEILGNEPAPALKTGGIGIVAVRGLGKRLDLDVHATALYLDVLHGAGLIAPAVIRDHRGPRGEHAGWVPTQAADTYLAGAEPAGWALVAGTWLDMRRNPAQVGRRDAADKIIGALSVQSDWRGGPDTRRRILTEIATLEPGFAATQASLMRRLAYRSPLQHGAGPAAQIDTVLAEATELGIVAFDALSTAGRALLGDDIEGAAAALDRALPDPVDTVLVQADLTLIAPGRLTAGLAAALAELADVESTGSATVYRLSEQSIRRALDAGFTGASLHALLAAHSATPVPQSVTYLIDDVARRHGVLRAGSAEAFMHSEDTGLIAQGIAAAAAAGIRMRSLAPTVAVSQVDLTTLVEALRAAGLAPAAEDASGTILDLRPAPRRTRITVPPRIGPAAPTAPSRDQVESVIRRMRAGDESRGAASDPGSIIAVLREAAKARRSVWIGYADAEGGTSTRMVDPIVVSGGTMVALDRLRQTPRTFTIHRISSASPAET